MRSAIAALLVSSFACRPAASPSEPPPSEPPPAATGDATAKDELEAEPPIVTPGDSKSGLYATGATGSLDKDEIRRVVREHLKEVRACYESALLRNRDLRGRVTVRFTISPTGSIADASVASNELGDAEVAECIRKAVTTWGFPEPEGNGNVVVTYPFDLQAG